MNTCSIFDERRPYGEAKGVRCTTREKKGRRDTSATSSFELLECALLLFVGRSIFSRWSLAAVCALCAMRFEVFGCGCVQPPVWLRCVAVSKTKKYQPSEEGTRAQPRAKKKPRQALQT